MIYWLLFVFGLLVGSFLNVIIYRETHEDEAKHSFLPSWAIGRSRCPKCKHQLAWFDNIPLLSFLILKGKCRYCQQKISYQYPFIELITGLEFVWVYWLLSRLAFFKQMEGFFSLGVLGFWLIIFSLSIILSWIDIKKQILPDSILIPAIILALLRLLITGRWQFLLTAVIAASFFGFLYLITKCKGIGFGDVKLGFFIGLVLGWWSWLLVALFIAFLTGAFVGVILIVVRKKTLKSAVPFGPFLLLGMLIAKIWGENIWLWYLGLAR